MAILPRQQLHSSPVLSVDHRTNGVKRNLMATSREFSLLQHDVVAMGNSFSIPSEWWLSREILAALAAPLPTQPQRA